MALDRFLIAPINTGLQTDVRPWQILDDAFSYLQNVYVFRGRVRKRFGTLQMGTLGQFSSRLRIDLFTGGAGIGITDASGSAAGNIRTILGDATFPIGADSLGYMFSIGTQTYTVISVLAGLQPMKTTSGSGKFNVTTGDFTITGAAVAPTLTHIIFYPGLPVMGITQYLSGAVNNHPSYAFDTRYAYTFTGNPAVWQRSGTAVWHGNNLNFFWATNWQGSQTTAATPPVMFVTNFNASIGAGKPTATDDPIWYFDGTNWYPLNASSAMFGTGAANSSGFFFLPSYGGSPQTQFSGPFVQTARIIVPFYNRLLLLNTVENDNSTFGANPGTGTTTAYVNRCRYSFNGSPFARNAWYEPNQSDSDVGATAVNNNNLAAGAGVIDAATDEQIISAQFVKDRLIVYFERSTWEIAYTGNEVKPFIWQRLNTELGSMSTFSTVPFDKAILTVGASGVHACNGSNVSRIDAAKIPDQIFNNFSTENNNAARVAGIRDYYTELVYWTYVDTNHGANQSYPNQVLVYNYRDGSWAINDDCFTCFGYFEQGTDMTWESSAPITWETANFTWLDNFIAANHRQILCGTPTGWILQVFETLSRNAPSMQITDLVALDTGITTLTIVNHNLDENPTQLPSDSDYILLEGLTGTASVLNGLIFQVQTTIDPNTITIITFLGSTDTYNGGGTAAKVSNTQIFTKQFNPYASKDRSVYLARVDFAVEKTQFGQITVDYYPSSSELSMLAAGTQTGSIMGSGILETVPYVLYPLEQEQDLLWHPIYFQSTGQFIQLVMYLSDLQMLTPNIALAPFEMQALCLYTQPTSYRME